MRRSNILWLCALLACNGVIGEPERTATAPDPEPPSDETRPPPGLEFECESGGVVDPGPSLVRRLTTPEYVAAVQTTLGVDLSIEAGETLPPDLRADGFSNTVDALVPTLLHVQVYERLAELAVSRTDLGALVARHAECTTFEVRCGESFISSFGAIALRGPLDEIEIIALSPVFAAAESEGETFEVAAGLVVVALLQSPRFLYRMEREIGDGAPRLLDDHELASRLSFLVWGSPPDDTLRALADAGRLHDEEVLEAELDRMLDDPRARVAAARFVSDWWNLGRLSELTRDEALYPDWSSTLGAAMRDETLALFEELWERDRPLMDLFDADFTYASRALAQHYGLPGADDAPEGVTRYDLSDVPERGGILTQGSVAIVGGDESSMVSRGLFLLGTALCGKLASAPPGVDTTPPEIAEGRSQRHYSEQRVNNPSCAGCHVQMEPLAWGLERFDATGVYRTRDHFGNALREDGIVQLPGGIATPYTDAVELGALLARSERARDCATLKAAQFARGRSALETDGCALAAVKERFSASRGTYRDLMRAIALGPGFRSVRTEVRP